MNCQDLLAHSHRNGSPQIFYDEDLKLVLKNQRMRAYNLK